jgi:hypothetical protein
VEPERPQMAIWRRVTGWVNKGTREQVHARVSAPTHTHTQICTMWFKYDRDDLCVNKSQFVPDIFEAPCIYLFLFHGNSGFANAPQYYVIRTFFSLLITCLIVHYSAHLFIQMKRLVRQYCVLRVCSGLRVMTVEQTLARWT